MLVVSVCRAPDEDAWLDATREVLIVMKSSDIVHDLGIVSRSFSETHEIQPLCYLLRVY